METTIRMFSRSRFDRYRMDLPGVAIMSSSPSCPTAQAGMNMVTRQLTGKESLPLRKCSRFPTSPLCPQLIKAATQSQLPVSSKDLPFLCAVTFMVKHKLNKICLEIFLGFPLNFYLGKPKNPNARNIFTLFQSVIEGAVLNF